MTSTNDNGFATLPETHIERMDRMAFERDAELEKLRIKEVEATKRAKLQHRSNRLDVVREVGIWVTAGVVVLGIFAGILYWILSPDQTPEGPSLEERREVSCIEKGGGWVPDDLIIQGDSGLCVYPGERAS